MKEDFLHLVWQYQYLDRNKAKIVDNELLTVIKPGLRNQNSGPDFLQATLRIGALEWIGSVEIHIRSSEWNLHHHQQDPAYQSVVLHVVWEKDEDVTRVDGSVVPTLELKNLVPLETILRYRQLMEQTGPWVPCEPFLDGIEPFRWINMQERVLVDRLQRKAEEILVRLDANQKDWLETFYQSVSWCIGLKNNAQNMQTLSEAIPIKVLAANGFQIESCLAIMLGMAGYLDPLPERPQLSRLYREFTFQSEKYGLKAPQLLWQKFRLRPASFPFLRIILLARIASQLPGWFHNLETSNSPQDFFSLIKLPALPQWVNELCHEAGYTQTDFQLTEFIKNSLVINVFTPFLVAISLGRSDPGKIEQALVWLSTINSEPNSIVKNWKLRGVEAKTAAQSQAMVELYTKFCMPKRCMACLIGNHILGKN